MKKLLILLGIVLLLSGCDLSVMTNTPTKQVEVFLNKYQTLDNDVLSDLDNVIAEEERFNTEQRDSYRDVMKSHYQDLKYNVKEETVDGDMATVTVEIEVTDFSRIMSETNLYLEQNPDEFNYTDEGYDTGQFIDYQLGRLKDANETVKYTLYLTLNKVDGKWQLNPLTETEQDKINGMYVY
jgi:hypothetical protein